MTRVGDANDLDMLERAFDVQAHRRSPDAIIVDSHIAYGSRTSRTRARRMVNRSAPTRSG